jgi:hypothetical protein
MWCKRGCKQKKIAANGSKRVVDEKKDSKMDV